MAGFITCPLVGLLVLFLTLRGMKGRERRLLQAGYLAHLGGTAGIIAYHSYVGGGDMIGYAFYGRQLARLMMTDLGYYVPEVVKLVFHLENALPAIISYDDASAEYLGGTTTTTMFAMTGLVMLVAGNTLTAASTIFGLFSFSGTAFFYKRLRSALYEHERIPVLSAFMFVPSFVFWSAGIVKEAVLLGFFGLLCGALLSLSPRPRVGSVLLAVIGAVGMGIVKPYVIFPLVLAAGAWMNSKRQKKHGWATRILAVVVAVLGLALVSRLFPQYGVERLGETVAGQQYAGTYSAGAGSYTAVGAADERSLIGQLRFIPLALLNALARPFLFEAKNASMAMAGLETTVAGVFLFTIARRHGLSGVWRGVVRRPPFVAALVFTLAFGAAVGLTTTNLGTLSRYRIPMVPLYAAVLLVLRTKESGATMVLAPRKPKIDPRLLRLALRGGGRPVGLPGAVRVRVDPRKSRA